jgi:NAD(P)H-dependent FMN reductase
MSAPEEVTRLMVIIGSVRPGRVGLPVSRWVEGRVRADSRFELDLVDLAEFRLPFMDEPAHPRLRQYAQPHTIEWSARVDAADAFIFVQPEYNYSYAPALKNAIDYLHGEWHRKPLGTVSYGGISGGTRGVVALRPTVVALGLVPTGPNVEISFVSQQLDDDGQFIPSELHEHVLTAMLDEIVALDGVLRPLR